MPLIPQHFTQFLIKVLNSNLARSFAGEQASITNTRDTSQRKLIYRPGLPSKWVPTTGMKMAIRTAATCPIATTASTAATVSPHPPTGRLLMCPAAQPSCIVDPPEAQYIPTETTSLTRLELLSPKTLHQYVGLRREYQNSHSWLLEPATYPEVW